MTSFKVFSCDDPWAALVHSAEERPVLNGYLTKRDWLGETRETFLPFYDQLRNFLPLFRPLWTHNDFHASNLFWSDRSPEAHVMGIIDVDLADRTTALHDVATAIERNGIEWLEIHDASHDPFHPEQIIALLKGYEEMRPLSRKEAEAVVTLLPLVHAEFALSEADYFRRVLKSVEKTDVAYIGYFLGHARWFNTDSGKRLLRHLQSWAESHPRPSETRPMVSEELRN